MKKPAFTFYSLGMFGLIRTPCASGEYGVKPYAQHRAVPWVRYVPHGKRKERGHWLPESREFFVVIKGDGPAAPGNESQVIEREGVTLTVSETAYCLARVSRAVEWLRNLPPGVEVLGYVGAEVLDLPPLMSQVPEST